MPQQPAEGRSFREDYALLLWEEAMNIYEVVNQKIVELLEQGTVPWRKPWNSESGQPKNLVSKKEYRGINTLLLGCQPYGSRYWLTFKQCQEKGGHVRKGEKATMVVFWKMLDRLGAGDSGEHDDEPVRNGKIPMLRYYNIFNWEQTEGIEAPPTQETHNIFTPNEKAQAIIDNMPLRPEILHGGNVASYSVRWDRVKMPEKHAFDSAEEWACCLFHELSHASGHEKRLNRKC